jgi:hypothetical protein
MDKNPNLSINPQDLQWQVFYTECRNVDAQVKKDHKGDAAAEDALPSISQGEVEQKQITDKAKRDLATLVIDQSLAPGAARAFRDALDQGATAVQTALSHSDKDGPKEHHAKVLQKLRELAKKHWKPLLDSFDKGKQP